MKYQKKNKFILSQIKRLAAVKKYENGNWNRNVETKVKINLFNKYIKNKWKKKQQMVTKREIKKMLQHKKIWLIVNEN